MRKLFIFSYMAAGVAGLALANPALAQISFPTAASGVRAPGTVPLQCDSSGANCAPTSGTNPIPIGGNVASGAADSGNPIKIGGRHTAATPTVADGQRFDLQLDPNANLRVAATVVGVSATDAVVNTVGQFLRNNTFATGLPIATAGYGFNGTTWDRLRGDANGLVVQPALTATYWSYTSGVTPILSNTATGVTIRAAAGAGVRSYIDSCQLTTTAFGASVPLALRDGTGGTVRWAVTVPTAGFLQPVAINFVPPLQGTANTLWEVATPTANTTGTVSFNCQGHTGI